MAKYMPSVPRPASLYWDEPIPMPEIARDYKLACTAEPTLFDELQPGEKNEEFVVRYNQAISICAACPIKDLCGDWYAKTGERGIAGGRYHGYLPKTIERLIFKYNKY